MTHKKETKFSKICGIINKRIESKTQKKTDKKFYEVTDVSVERMPARHGE